MTRHANMNSSVKLLTRLVLVEPFIHADVVSQVSARHQITDEVQVVSVVSSVDHVNQETK